MCSYVDMHMRISVGSGQACLPGPGAGWRLARRTSSSYNASGYSGRACWYNCAAGIECNLQLISVSHDPISLLMVRPGESGGRYVCELLVSLPDSSAS